MFIYCSVNEACCNVSKSGSALTANPSRVQHFYFALWQLHSNDVLNFAVHLAVLRAKLAFAWDTVSYSMQALYKELHYEAHILQQIYGNLASLNYLKNFLRLKNCLACEQNSGRILMPCSLERKTMLHEDTSHVSLSSPTSLPRATLS